jgi:thiol-disulfide isomerase/thioredoxin
MFHGQECPHCQAIHPIVDKLIQEGFEIDKLEVWHSQDNEELMNNYAEIITSSCGGNLGVPSFLDIEGNRATCGVMSYDNLRAWIINE